MISFIIRNRVQPLGNRKGKTLYYASPKGSAELPLESIKESIVQATSLARGDLENALTSLAEQVCVGLREGCNIDLGPLGRLVVNVPSKCMDKPEEVTAKDALCKPKITFYPTRAMQKALGEIEMRIER
ncbi:MAG: DNA-binding protein [Prevotellaceae bacterium]|nr:DNA-binding protein [Prevotellaceae bacterium]